MSAVLVLGKSVVDQLLAHDFNLSGGFDADANLAMARCGTEMKGNSISQ